MNTDGQKFGRYWQLVLGRPGMLAIGGLSVAPLNIAPMMADPALRKLSVMSRFPAGLLLSIFSSPAQLLRPYEAQGFCKLRAA